MRSKFVGAVVSVVACGLAVAACSSAPGEGAGQSDEALVGGRPPPCPSWGCNGPPIQTVCEDHPTCWTSPSTWATVPQPFFGLGPKWQQLGAELKQEMINAGCQTPFWYAQCGADGYTGCAFLNQSLAWPAAMCPLGVNADIDARAGKWCDQCTGQLPRGWGMMVWDPSGTQPSGCHPNTQCQSN